MPTPHTAHKTMTATAHSLIRSPFSAWVSRQAARGRRLVVPAALCALARSAEGHGISLGRRGRRGPTTYGPANGAPGRMDVGVVAGRHPETFRVPAQRPAAMATGQRRQGVRGYSVATKMPSMRKLLAAASKVAVVSSAVTATPPDHEPSSARVPFCNLIVPAAFCPPLDI